MGSTLVAFIGGAEGHGRVERLDAVTGPALPGVNHLAVVKGPPAVGFFADAAWVLRGAVSYSGTSDALSTTNSHVGRLT